MMSVERQGYDESDKAEESSPQKDWAWIIPIAFAYTFGCRWNGDIWTIDESFGPVSAVYGQKAVGISKGVEDKVPKDANGRGLMAIGKPMMVKPIQNMMPMQGYQSFLSANGLRWVRVLYPASVRAKWDQGIFLSSFAWGVRSREG